MKLRSLHITFGSSRADLRPASLLALFTLATAFVLVGPAAFAKPTANESGDRAVSLEISRIGDATHFEFSGTNDWKYSFKRDSGNEDRVNLRLTGLRSGDVAKLKALGDSLIKKVQVTEGGVDGSAEIAFQIGSNTDFFDYITDQPSRLIIDFFPKDGGEGEKSEKKAENAPPAKKAESLPLKRVVRAELPPAASEEDEADDEQDGSDRFGESRVQTFKLPEFRKDGRGPAGIDGRLVAKALPPAPTLAEELSSNKDFSHGIFDGGDPEFRRFTIRDYEIKEDAIIASRANFYLPFPMLDLGTPQLKALIDAPPTYDIIPDETRENKEARVLLNLFNEKKRALFLKTAGEFLHDHPESRYDEIIRYLIADSHYDIYRASNSVQDFEVAMSHYLALAEKYPKSPMQPRTLLFMGYSYLDRGDTFGALKAFRRFTRQHPDSKHIDRVNISIATAFLKLDRYDDALQLLDQVEKTGKTKSGRAEAAYRKGDVRFRNHDFAGAIDSYKEAIKNHPEAADRFPNAWYNTAEAEFLLNRYKDGLESYRRFLVKFPDHDHGGYAMTRMGELLGIVGADPKRAQGAFMESYFRYRATPGAGVARIRLLTSRMSEMKDKEFASAMYEIAEIAKKYENRPKTKAEIEAEKKAEDEAKKLADEEEAKGKKGGEHGGGEGEHGAAPAGGEHGGAVAAVKEGEEPVLERLVPKGTIDATAKKPELPGISEFTTLLIGDAFHARQDYDKAAEVFITYYQQNPQTPQLDRFKTRIVREISSTIRSAVDRGDFIDALRRYSKNLDGWLKNSDRIDVRFNVGKAYEQAGVFKEALGVYDDCVKRLAAIKGKKEEREHSVFESLPSAETVELRSAATAAKASDFANAEGHLRKIALAKNLSQPEQIERAEVSAEVAEARGQGEVARKYLASLVDAWDGDPQLTSPLLLRMARLEIAAKLPKVADGHLAKIVEWKKEDGARVSDEVHAKALEMRGDLYVSRGMRKDAVKTYRELLAAYETTRPLASVRYRLGQVLYQDGDLKGAEIAWSELKSSSGGKGENDLWQRLADEQMQGAKWQKEYKKYLDRIPAAADLRQ